MEAVLVPGRVHQVDGLGGLREQPLIVLEAVRVLNNVNALQRRFPPLGELRAVRERARVYQRRGRFCPEGLAIRDTLSEAISETLDVLPPPAARLLQALSQGDTAADVARELGIKPAALRKRWTNEIAEALVSYLEYLETLEPYPNEGVGSEREQ
jgi:hypothetical protein